MLSAQAIAIVKSTLLPLESAGTAITAYTKNIDNLWAPTYRYKQAIFTFVGQRDLWRLLKNNY